MTPDFPAEDSPDKGSHGSHNNRIVTIPNLLTVVRFLGVPLFVWLVLGAQNYGWAVVVLAIMGSTDWIDGYVARRFNQESELGRVLDPAADRVALITVALTLVIAQIAPWWLFAAIVIPDAILFLTSLILLRWHPDLPVTRVGKIRTAALLVGTPMLLLARAISPEPNPVTVVAWIFLGIGLLGHMVAFVDYFKKILAKSRQLKALQTAEGAIPADDEAGKRP